MKKLVSILLCMVVMLSMCAIGTYAETAPAGYIGDINLDKDVDINDATYIMRYVAKLEDVDIEQKYLGDVTNDGKITILDATNIQLYVAKKKTDYKINYSYNYDMMCNDCFADYESGVAMAGVPVTFAINAYAGSPVLGYELYVDETCVATSDTNSITYTFEKSGIYQVELRINALYKTGYRYFSDYEVVEPYESETPMFKTLYTTGKIQWGTITYDQKGVKVHADAIGGKGPYQYKFVFVRPKSAYIDETEIITKVQEYSENNIYELEVIKLEDVYHHTGINPDLECKVTVYIKDANGVEVSRELPILYVGEFPVG